MNILLIGNGAREHVVAETFKKSPLAKLYVYMKTKNPGLVELAEAYHVGDYGDKKSIIAFAEEHSIDFAFIGPEDPLARGVVDWLLEEGIESIGPRKVTAQLESSKTFTRDILAKYDIPGNVTYRAFTSETKGEIDSYIAELGAVVIKPDGLTGGKGVRVQGDHFQTRAEAVAYCNEVLETHPRVIVEEKIVGQEFSLQCLTDGIHVLSFPLAQDHKRAFNDDKGPNTGGMGSYSWHDHLLPFLTKEHFDQAVEITKQVADAIKEETGFYYRGIMYGGFMLTKDGVKLIEYNARFGDPEVMNILPLLKTDFVMVCQAMIAQELDRIKLECTKEATVCKYVVPEGYPDNPVKNEKVDLGTIPDGVSVYYASVDKKDDGLYMTGSRAIAFLGKGKNIEEAEQAAEQAASSVKGKVFHRTDIGTKKLIDARIAHMKAILGEK